MQIRDQWNGSKNWKRVTGAATAATLSLGALAVAVSAAGGDAPKMWVFLDEQTAETSTAEVEGVRLDLDTSAGRHAGRIAHDDLLFRGERLWDARRLAFSDSAAAALPPLSEGSAEVSDPWDNEVAASTDPVTSDDAEGGVLDAPGTGDEAPGDSVSGATGGPAADVPAAIADPSPNDSADTPDVVGSSPDDSEDVPNVVDPSADDSDDTPDVVDPSPDDSVDIPDVVDASPDDSVDIPDVVDVSPDDSDDSPDILDDDDSILDDDDSPDILDDLG